MHACGTLESMAPPAPELVSYEAYLEAERKSETKHEWLNGVVYAMAGGTLEHSRLAARLGSLLQGVHADCEVFQSDAKTFVEATRLSTYPDITIVCGPLQSQKVEKGGRVIGEAILNPTVVVEVLSDSTEAYDRGEKFAHYAAIASLQEYVLVAQSAAKVEVFRRPERGHWIRDEAGAGESIVIHGKSIAVDDIYRRASPSVS